MELDKYKIAPIKAAKNSFSGDYDEKEERFKQDTKIYPVKEVNNEKVFEIRTKRIIDMLDDNDPRKRQYKKMFDEHKEMLRRDMNKKLNEKDETPVNKVDDIIENYPSAQDIESKLQGSQKIKINKKLDELYELLSDAMPQGHAKIDELINELQAEINEAADNMLLTADDAKEGEEREEENKEKKVDKAPVVMDVFDVAEGLPLGDGMMAHKDEKTGEIYVIDKNGNELVRTVNAFVNDMGLVIEFYRDLLGLTKTKDESNKEEKEEKEENEEKVESATVPTSALVDEDKIKEDEEVEQIDEKVPPEEQLSVEKNPPQLDAEPTSEQLSDELSRELDELLKVQKEQSSKIDETTKESEGEDSLDRSSEEMLNLQYEIEEKKNKVKSAIQYMIDNDKISVTPEEISACKIKGESVIFAKQRAKEAKIQELVSKLYNASNEMIDMYIEAQRANDNNEADSIFQQLFK